MAEFYDDDYDQEGESVVGEDAYRGGSSGDEDYILNSQGYGAQGGASSGDSGTGGMSATQGAFGIAGSFLGAAGSIYQGQSNANVADYNASIADQNASIAESQGAEAARRSLVNSSKITGAAAAGYGASNVSGVSASLVLQNSAAQGELNALTIQHSADLRANAYTNEAALDEYRAGNDRLSGYMGAAASIMNGAKSFTSMAALA